MACSEQESCLFPDDEFYKACMYRKNLEAGRIFYGSKAREKNKIPVPENKVILNLQNPERNDQVPEETVKIPERFRKNQERIYLDCYQRHFNVGHLSGKDLTYPLTEQEAKLLQETFRELEIPYVCQADENKCILEGTKEEPANARVSFCIQGSEQKFVIANFNSCLILKRYADGIAKALKAKGIEANVHLMGAYDRVVDYKRVPELQTKNELKPERNENIALNVTSHETRNEIRNGNLIQKSIYQENKEAKKGVISGQMNLFNGLAV